MTLKVLNSELDASVNHVYEDGSEFRIVGRDDHPTIYLSSHTGCGLGCQMCHLTTTGQTRMMPLSLCEMHLRASKLIPERGRINFAFMARGDALANANVNGELVKRLLDSAPDQEHAKVTISSIFPRKAVGTDIAAFLFQRFGAFQPTIYWSLYMLDHELRKTWLPEAQEPTLVAQGLREWQKVTFQDIVVHHALIDGVNSDGYHLLNIVDFLKEHKLRCRVNLVRYNPPDGNSREAHDSTYEVHRRIYARMFGEENAKVQPRVGFDVKASCGMFVAPGDFT